jgi:hypothetical protein
MEVAVKIINIAVVLIVTISPAFAQNAAGPPGPGSRPTDESVRQLLAVMDSQKLVEAIPQQVDSMMKATLQQSLQGQVLSPPQQQAIDQLQARVAALMKEEVDWSVLEPMYIKLYEDSFSQAEVDGLVAFYKSPAGKAVVHKLPLVMQNLMVLLQQRMARMIPKIQQMAQETAAQIKAQGAAAASGKSG